MANFPFQQSYLSYVAETTPGTTPGSPSMLKIRNTNPLSPTPNKALLESEEVFSHRQEENTRHGMRGFSGSIPTELSFAAFDDWLEALVGGAWSTETSPTPEVLKVGTNVYTFTVEQFIGASTFIQGIGVTPTQLSLTINPNSIVQANWDVIGMDFQSATSTLGSASNVASNEPFDGLGNAAVLEGGSSIATVTSIEMTINANKNVGGIVGSNAGDDPSDGLLQITGNITARFDSLALFQKFENETDSSLEVELTDPGGSDTLTIELPRLKYTGGQPQNNDNVIDGNFGFRGLYDPTESSSIVITRSNS